jgi:hypothetical protein
VTYLTFDDKGEVIPENNSKFFDLKDAALVSAGIR